jgi:hypothetical protein
MTMASGRWVTLGQPKILDGRVALRSSRMVAGSCPLGPWAVSPGAKEMARQGIEQVILQRLTPRLPVPARGPSSMYTPPPLTSTVSKFHAGLDISSDEPNVVEGRQE